MRVALSKSDFTRLPPEPCIFVPTRGGLHAGHAALIRAAAAMAAQREAPGGCVVSIFVHPDAFASSEAFAAVPRDLDADLKVCNDAGATVVFAPRDDDVFPPDEHIPPVPLPPVATEPGLEDAHIADCFAHVCRVTRRMMTIVNPDTVIVGDKDWQQLQTLRAMVRSQRLRGEVLGVPITRDHDGVPTSIRNERLSPDDRVRAQALNRALRQALGAATPDAAEELMQRVLDDAGVQPDYAVVREAVSLQRPRQESSQVQWRALIAATFGTVRVLDNAAWQPRA